MYRTESYVALIVFLIGLTAIAIGFWDDITTDKKLAITLASLTLFMLTERLAGLVASLKEDRNRLEIHHLIDNGIDSLQRELRCASTVSAILRPSEAFMRLSTSKKHPILVKDTIFRFDGEHTYARDTSTYDLSHEWFKKCIDARCSWYDIMTPNIIAARKRHIEHGLKCARFEKQYRCKTLSLGAPTTNFIVVTYEDGDREALFGWDYNSTPNSLVIATTNPRLVEYFDRLFDQLFALGSDIALDDYPKANQT